MSHFLRKMTSTIPEPVVKWVMGAVQTLAFIFLGLILSGMSDLGRDIAELGKGIRTEVKAVRKDISTLSGRVVRVETQVENLERVTSHGHP